ncbi:hypothetical protein BABINDRAFT_27655, partial [Babjeviella inositovora NRRL Y-12698]
KVPITIISGYLGSGKSTLLDHIALRNSNTGKKFAIIVNEFGNSSLIEKSKSFKITAGTESYDEWLDLGNGCLCCSVKDTGVAAIENLLSQEKKFDYVLLETSGVADPGPIANMFWLDDGLKSNVYIDGVVVVVDAKNILDCLSDTDGQWHRSNKHIGEEAEPVDDDGVSMAHVQISFADVILLNKIDLLETEPDYDIKLETIKTHLRKLNGLAQIHETRFGELDNLDKILNLNAFTQAKLPKEIARTHHDERIATISFQFNRIPAAKVPQIEACLQHLLWEHPDLDGSGKEWEIYRTKGLVIVEGEEDTWKIIQGVRGTYDIMEGANLEAESDGKSVVVFIGKHLS